MSRYQGEDKTVIKYTGSGVIESTSRGEELKRHELESGVIKMGDVLQERNTESSTGELAPFHYGSSSSLLSAAPHTTGPYRHSGQDQRPVDEQPSATAEPARSPYRYSSQGKQPKQPTDEQLPAGAEQPIAYSGSRYTQKSPPPARGRVAGIEGRPVTIITESEQPPADLHGPEDTTIKYVGHGAGVEQLIKGAITDHTPAGGTVALINDDKSDIGRTFVREDAAAAFKEKVVDKGVKTRFSEGQQTGAAAKKRKGRHIAGYIADDIERGLAAADESDFENRLTKKTAVTLYRTPRNIGRLSDTAKVLQSGGRYTKRAIGGVLRGDRTLKSIFTDKNRGIFQPKNGTILRGASEAIEHFSADGADDLGLETVVSVKNRVIDTYRLGRTGLHAGRYTVKGVKAGGRYTAQSVKKTAATTKKVAEQAAETIRKTAAAAKQFFSNPIVIKSIGIILIVIVLLSLIMGLIGAVTSLVSTSHVSNEHDISNTHLYITELDFNTEFEVENAPNEWKWRHIDEFHIYKNITPETDTTQFLCYLTSKYDDFTLEAVKKEINSIHEQLYTITYREWEEKIVHESETGSWTETIYHLDITLDGISFVEWLESSGELDESQKQRYQVLLDTNGGFNMLQSLGSPFIGRPITVSSRYGYRVHPITHAKNLHTGVDLPQPYGTEINATMGGTVTTASNDPDGYGLYIIIEKGSSKTLYAHCSRLLVSAGQTVKKGDVIALVGSTGSSTGNHLHLEYFKDGERLNPYFHIAGRDQE